MEQYLKDTGFKLGELMGYEKCTDDENCIVHQGNHTGVNASDKNVWYMLESGVYTKVTNKLAMVLADYTLEKIQTEGFSAVTVGDLFPEAYEDGPTNPLSLMPQTTVIDNIPEAFKSAMSTKSIGDLQRVGLIDLGEVDSSNDTQPNGFTSAEKLNSVFGDLYDNEKDSNSLNDYLTVALGETEANALVANADSVYNNTTGTEEEKIVARNQSMWQGMTASELVDVIVTVLDVALQII